MEEIKELIFWFFVIKYLIITPIGFGLLSLPIIIYGFWCGILAIITKQINIEQQLKKLFEVKKEE